MLSPAKKVALEAAPKQGITFRVLSISHSFFCVYADAALIDFYADWVSADDLCRHMRNQVLRGKDVRHGHQTMNDLYPAA